MAIQENDLFTPDKVDAQIEQLSQGLNLSQQRLTANAQLIRHLRFFYRTNSQEEDARSLQQAWLRISHLTPAPLSEHSEFSAYRQNTLSGNGHTTNLKNPAFPKKRNLQQRLSMIAAVAVVILLVGSMALVANFVHPKNTSGGTVIGTATHKMTSTPASSPITLSQNTGKIIYSASYGFNDIYTIAWSPDSQRIATANDNDVQAIDAVTGNHAVNYSISLAYSVAWSPEGKRIAASSDRVYIWDASSARLLRTYPPATAQASILPPSHNASIQPLFASSHRTVSYISAFSPTKNHTPTSGGNPLLATAWSPNGKLMATAFDGNVNGNTVQVWNTTSGMLIQTYHGHNDFIESLSWSPDGTRIASASVDEVVHVWDATSGQTLLTFRGQSRNSEEVHWSPDGKRIAFIGDNNNVLVWNAVTGKTLVVHHQHSKFGLSSLIWSPNGAFIASAGDTVELWHANTGKTLYTFTKNPHPIRTLSWSPNGKLIASATGPGELGPAPIVLQVWIAS
jgi:WD40 repeat protein